MSQVTRIPFIPYRLFFLYIEPTSALAGAWYASFRPQDYLRDLSSSGTPWIPTAGDLSTQTTMTLLQLANLYLLFATNEYCVLSSTNDVVIWRSLLFGLLVADFGHLITMAPLGGEVFWKFWDWNAMKWGSVGFVYLGATLRICFLAGIGLKRAQEEEKKRD
ncbi:hypothetical protein CVT26_009943 [Gymnopilus dilepis]|uniref:DUF7704 domain-containing protein n=1 Tax=Gymnopilus dilepis TaxID=231916 RepID=A0A409VL40_9AGAR|nr:hypothetical protein CVT26_009943 [Gymnopilus dilepis]